MTMKVSVKKIVEAYKMLGEAKVTNLGEAEVVKVIKARKAMRPIAEEFEAFLKDAQDKFRPEDWEETQKMLAKWQEEGEKTTLSEAERIGLNKAVIGYQSAINKAVSAELEREREIEFVKLVEGADIKLLSANGWTIGQLDVIDFIL